MKKTSHISLFTESKPSFSSANYDEIGRHVSLEGKQSTVAEMHQKLINQTNIYNKITKSHSQSVQSAILLLLFTFTVHCEMPTIDNASLIIVIPFKVEMLAGLPASTKVQRI